MLISFARAKKHDQQLGHAGVKRPSDKKRVMRQPKRPRLQDMLVTMATKTPTSSVDPTLTGKGKKPEIRLAESITSALERTVQRG